MKTASQIKLGIQGGPGSFNEAAALKHMDDLAVAYTLVYLHTTENVLAALNDGSIERGQFAIYNSLGGVVEESLKPMGMGIYRFSVIDKFSIPIAHCLMKRKGVEINRVMAHPQVLKQCQVTLSREFPELERVSGTGTLIDTAMVAQKVAAGELPADTAVAGNRKLAEMWDFEIVRDNLQDASDNRTTFLWVIPLSL